MRTLMTNIGELVTNEKRDTDPLGIRHDAAVLLDGDRIAWVGDASAALAVADDDGLEVVDAAGKTVIPGFVDSHTHVVFGGDRSAEFAARMAGEAYTAGGIRSTVEATRAASDDELRARLAGFVSELHAQGTTTFEVKTGYGLTVHDEERLARLAREVTDEVTFLGAHVVPPEYREQSAPVDAPTHAADATRADATGSPRPERGAAARSNAARPPGDDADGRGTADDYVDLVCGPMLDACAPHVRWVDAFCERGAFTPEQSRRVLEAGAARGLGIRVHGNQLGHGDGVRLAVELGAASVDHCTYLSDEDVALLAASGTVCTLLPGVEFSTRQPYPDARRLLDAGARVALASDCNPGSSFTSSMAFCIAVAVRDMGFTAAEALWAATAGGAAALRRDDVGRIAPGARADLVLLDAPSHVHLAYRPGVPLVAQTWVAGQRT